MNFPTIRLAIGLAAILIAALPAVSPAAEVTVAVTSGGQAIDDAVVLLRQAGLDAAFEPTAVMDQKNHQFAPFVLPVATGTAVSFPNSDNIRHHVYSFSPAKRFELRLYSGTPSEPVIFDNNGIVTLGCNIHDWMLGFIYVTDAPRFGVTGTDGRVHFSDVLDAPVEITVWHPRMGTTTEAVTANGQSDSVIPVELELGPPTRREPPEDSHPSPFGRRNR
ncbi:MAG TPA: methylamine utilization protein [Gammaproteobacteria bacterium]